MSIQYALNEFINNPYDDKVIFNLANSYYDQNQTASALTYYLRVTELDSDLVYSSLLRAGLCLEKQADRVFSTKGLYLHAISHSPKRPEAYFLLSRLYECNKEHQESYTIASLAESVCQFNLPLLNVDVEYPGKYGFKFEKAVCSWWIGRVDESLDLFLDLHHNETMLQTHIDSVKSNLTFLWGNGDWEKPSYYDSTKSNDLRFKFKGIEKIKNNQSQVFQDMFVLMALDGKTKGKYLEIGAHEPVVHSNTYILEKYFNWKGISLEIDSNLVNKFNGIRDNFCLLQDATNADYDKILSDANLGTDWDYLQLDCEPPSNTFSALQQIPFEKYRFAVITYEHDYYCDDTKLYRDKSRKYLESKGYELVVDNISADDNSPFEDWWMHPDLVDKDVLSMIKSVTNTIKKAENYIYNK
jgi:tetratricopeptide (TPR) repeat protein